MSAMYGILDTGVAYDSSVVKDEDRTVTLPMGQSWRFGQGAQYQLSESLNLGAAYTFLWTGDMPVDQGIAGSVRGRVSGSCDDTWFSFINLNLSWHF